MATKRLNTEPEIKEYVAGLPYGDFYLITVTETKEIKACLQNRMSLINALIKINNDVDKIYGLDVGVCTWDDKEFENITDG